MDKLQQKKLERVFRILDQNGDGFLEEVDYTRAGDQVAQNRGLQADSPQYQQMRQRMHDYWEALLARADKNGDQRISREEWMASIEENSAAVEQAHSQMIGLLAVLLDRNGDGRITLEDYRLLLHDLGYEMDQAETVFARIDLNGDGQIDQAELVRLTDEFFHSTDPEAPGNWMLGIL
ncbi:MAG TPA: EF-hand domain-containing protein [Chloroflexia bacterium]|nr:EF-hand domain-containing protein [Chloroflexia bacterium]